MAQLSIRIERRLREIATEAAQRNETELSDYIRGLIISDASDHGVSLAGLNIPGWLIGTRVEISKKPLAQETDPEISEQEEEVERQTKIARKVHERHTGPPEPRKTSRPKAS